MAEVNLKVSADIQGIKTKLEELTKSVAEVQSKMGNSFKAAAETSEKAMVDASNTITATMVNNTTKVISSLEKEEDQLKALQMMMKQSTNPDAQKSLQKEIDATNARIKSLGGSMQKFRDISVMSLGEMRKYMRELRGISLVGMTPEQINKVNTQMALLKDKMADYSKMLSTTGDKTQMLIGAMQGFVGIAQGVTGTLSLMGIENKNLEKSMMALINLSQMMSTFHQLEESGILAKMGATIKDTAAKYLNITATRAQAISQQASTASTKAGAIGFKLLGAAMKALPIMWLIAGVAAIGTGIAYLTGAFDSETDSMGRNVKAMKAVKTAMDEGEASTMETQVKLKSLLAVVNDHTRAEEQRQFALDEMNNIMGTTLTLTDDLTTATKNYINSLVSQAQADAIIKNMAEINNKIIDTRHQMVQVGNNVIYGALNDSMNELIAQYTTMEKELQNIIDANIENQIVQGKQTEATNKQADALKAQQQAVDNASRAYDELKMSAKRFYDELEKSSLTEMERLNVEYNEKFALLDSYYAKGLLDENKFKVAEAQLIKEYVDKEAKILNDASQKEVDTYEQTYEYKAALAALNRDEMIKYIDEQLAAESLSADEIEALLYKKQKAFYDYYDSLYNSAKEQAELDKEITTEELKWMDSLIKKRDEYISTDKNGASTEEDPYNEEGIWQKRIDIAKQMAGKLYDVYKQGIDNQIKALDDLINQREQRIGEIQSLLEAEIQLNKDGFASNIQMYQTQLEQEQKLRDEALERQAKYNKQKSIMEAFEQSMDIGTAIASILKDAAVKTGLVAPISGAVAIAAFLALWAKAKSQATVKYEHGGRGVFEGASHSQGGIPFGNNMEAQGGEAYYILNKSATNSKGRKLMDVLFDAVNGGRVNFDAPLALADTPISVEMKEQREIKEIWKHLKGQKSTVYGADYRIETFGNVKRKIKN